MGCTASVYASARKKKKTIPQVTVFVPSIRVPAESDLQRTLKGLIPKDLAHQICLLRNRIMFVAQDTGKSFSLDSCVRIASVAVTNYCCR